MKQILIMLVISCTCFAYAQDKNSPRTLKGVLVEQLRTTHNQKEWFASADDALKGLSAEQANWTDGKGNHSIAQETTHLLYWDKYELDKFQGKTPAKYSGNNDDTFTKVDDKQWAATVKQLDEVMTQWEQAVQSADDKKVAEWASTIAHIGTHNAYHLGQIVYIRKLQGSWNPSLGVR